MLNKQIPDNWADLYMKNIEALSLYEALLDESIRLEMRWHHAYLRCEMAEVDLAVERRSHAIYSLREDYAEFNATGADYYAKKAIARQ